MTLRAIPVEHDDQVERMRLLRNATKDGYSAFNENISEAAQITWWRVNRANLRAWLYADEAGLIVGFGLLRRDDAGRWLTTVGVLPEHSGRGYGKWITHDIVFRAPGRCWAAARRDNPAAVALHVGEDWEVIDGYDPRLVYFRTRPSEPRDFTFAMHPSLRPSFAAESGPDCRVAWRRQPDGRLVRVTSWLQSPVRSGPSPWLDTATGRELSR